MWLPESMGFYYTWILSLYIWGERPFFFLFVSSLCLQGLKWKMSVRHTGHYEIRTKDIPKRGEKMWGSILNHLRNSFCTIPYSMDKLGYLNSGIWKWIIIIWNLSTKLKQKQWYAPGRYTICSSHSWKSIFSLHYNTVL